MSTVVDEIYGYKNETTSRIGFSYKNPSPHNLQNALTGRIHTNSTRIFMCDFALLGTVTSVVLFLFALLSPKVLNRIKI